MAARAAAGAALLKSMDMILLPSAVASVAEPPYPPMPTW
jgi:hypothetical protein